MKICMNLEVIAEISKMASGLFKFLCRFKMGINVKALHLKVRVVRSHQQVFYVGIKLREFEF